MKLNRLNLLGRNYRAINFIIRKGFEFGRFFAGGYIVFFTLHPKAPFDFHQWMRYSAMLLLIWFFYRLGTMLSEIPFLTPKIKEE
jgi:hypothetical protein